MNQWKSAHAVKTDLRSLEEAMRGADVFLGVSAKGGGGGDARDGGKHGARPGHLRHGQSRPPRSRRKRHRPFAPTRSSRRVGPTTPTRSTTCSGSPYLFRGALDIHARAINDEMKIACAHALARLAREDVPDRGWPWPMARS